MARVYRCPRDGNVLWFLALVRLVSVRRTWRSDFPVTLVGMLHTVYLNVPTSTTFVFP